MGTEELPVVEDAEKTISELEQKIIRQVEYYFGDFNLSKDKFLKTEITKDDGWVALETMVRFNRLKSLSTDYNEICGALKKSPNNLLEINEDCTKLRRRSENPVPDENYMDRSCVEDRSLYVKGFKKTTTLDELLDFFKGHKAQHILMRRRLVKDTRVFKGSCFIVFDTKEDADKFLETKGIKFENTELLKERKKDYVKRKDVFYANLKAEKEKKLQKKTEENPDGTAEVTEVPEIKVEPGCLLKVEGLADDLMRETIKEEFSKFGAVVYVDYNRGQTEAIVRFEKGMAAETFAAAEETDGVKQLEVFGKKVTVSLIEGDAETAYWKQIAIRLASAKARRALESKHKKENKGRFQKHWGKRKGGKGRKGDQEGEDPPSKKMKTESTENSEEKSMES